MGVKTFTNQTSYPLSIVLTVRSGEVPGTPANTQEFDLPAGQSQVYTYSQGSVNPFLDSLVALLDSAGNLIDSQQAVTIRSSAVDDALNRNSTVVFALQGQSLVVNYSNG